MIDLGSSEFYLSIPSFQERELQDLSNSLFDSWEKYTHDSLSLEDYALFLQVEEGSVKGIAKIAAALSVLYMAIGNYGDFISGVKTIHEQVTATGDFLSTQAQSVFSCPKSKATTRKKGGDLKSLQNLFARVQRGDLSPEEATTRAAAMFSDEIPEAPGFLNALRNAFFECPLYHQQQDFPFLDDSEPEQSNNPNGPHRQKNSRTVQIIAPSRQLRIEVWRDSKNKKKHTRILKK